MRDTRAPCLSGMGYEYVRPAKAKSMPRDENDHASSNHGVNEPNALEDRARQGAMLRQPVSRHLNT